MIGWDPLDVEDNFKIMTLIFLDVAKFILCKGLFIEERLAREYEDG